MKNKLERTCEFSNQCAEGNYGSEEICRTDYQICKRYIKKAKELRDDAKQWTWWQIDPDFYKNERD